jgi:PAS domain S-box-containing protein
LAHEVDYIQELNNKVAELEQQLAEAKAMIFALTKPDPLKTNVHHEAGDVLRQSEEKFSLAFQSNAAGMAIARAVDAYFTDVNTSFCQIVGYSREEIIGRTFLDLGFFTKAISKEIMLQVQQQGKVHNQELDIFTKHRLTRRVMFSLDPIDIAGEPGFLATIVDITERKQAEEALAESERRQREITRLLELDQARLATVLRHLPVGVWIADQNGRLTGSNEQADRIGGGRPTEYQTYTAWYPESGELLQPDEYPMIVALRTGQPVEPMELNIRRSDGSQGTMLVSATPIKDRQGLVTDVVEVNVDITERKRAEEALRKSEERFAKAFRASPNAITISQIADGRILEVNEGWKTIFGHTPEEVLGRTSAELGIYVDLEDRKKIITRIKENRFVRDHELQMRHRTGGIRQVSMSAERIEINGVDCLLSIIRDITEEKIAEQALRDSEHRLKRAQEIAHLGSWELDLIHNRLTWSDEVYRIFGLEPQQFAATYEAFLEAVHPDDRAAVNAAYFGSIDAGKDSYEIEHRVVRRTSGEVRIVHEKCEHFRDESGKIIRSIGMVHDITERQLAKEQLRAYAERLENSNRH